MSGVWTLLDESLDFSLRDIFIYMGRRASVCAWNLFRKVPRPLHWAHYDVPWRPLHFNSQGYGILRIWRCSCHSSWVCLGDPVYSYFIYIINLFMMLHQPQSFSSVIFILQDYLSRFLCVYIFFIFHIQIYSNDFSGLNHFFCKKNKNL